MARTASNKLSEDSYVDPEFGAVAPGKRKKSSSFFDSLKEELACDSINREKSVPECNVSSAVCLKSDQQGNMAEVEVVTFHGRPKKKTDKWDNSEVNDSKVRQSSSNKINWRSRVFQIVQANLEEIVVCVYMHLCVAEREEGEAQFLLA